MNSAAVRRASSPELLAGRYEVELLLGSGGMGDVHRVLDRTTGRRIALKRLRRQASATQRTLFEREFHTLASLKHPHIVEVYDYGVADDALYYTMELLQGGDLRDLAPMPWREACRCLRDVASTLGLLHARRLLHRDLSPRNVWRNLDGSIKLLDFGALAAFGVPRNITGTPAFIPPEALSGVPLDQRSDLYMVGALGYWLLTGHTAYVARQISELFEAWKRVPATPSQRIAELGRDDLSPPPPELDALVEALLSQTPSGRPASTAEVVDALGEMAGLERINTHSAAQGYLHSKAFVGRTREREQLRTHLATAQSGVGGCFLYQAASGLGRSRLLSELALVAQLSGAHVLNVSAGSCDGPYGLVRALSLALLDAVPEEATEAARPFAAVLGHLSAEVRARLGGPELPLAALSEATGEKRVRLQAALRDWFLEVARARLLVLAVDDLERADESSAAVLAALAAAAKGCKLLLLGTLSTNHGELGPGLQAVRQLAARVRLEPLSSEEVAELLRSVFDEVPHLTRLAERLSRVAQGNPAYCMELCEHLVREGVIRYADGAWLIPSEIDDAQLPKSRDDALLERLDRISGDARGLAQLLSLVGAAASLETCMALSELSAETTDAALRELVAHGVVTDAQGSYRVAHPVLQKALTRGLDAAREQRAHRVLGELLLQRGALDVVQQTEAGLHLLRGGDQRGAAMIVAASMALTGADALIAASPLLENALAIFRKQGRRPHEQLAILGRLATAAYYVDRRLARYGHEAMDLLESVFGLRAARKLARFLGRKLSIVLVLIWTGLGFALRRRNPLVPPFRETLSLFFQAVSTMTGVATVCIDPDRATRYAQLLEPFTALGPDHVASLVCEFNLGLAATVRDQPSEGLSRWQRLLTRLKSPAPIVGMPDDVRKLYLAGALYARGVLECFRESENALKYADELSQLDMGMYEMSADQLRLLYHGHQGNLALCERYRQRVELHAVSRGSAWQVEMWSPGAMMGVHLRTDDALTLKRDLEELKRLQAEVPSLSVYVMRSTGAYLLLRRKYAAALSALSSSLTEKPLALVGWARTHGTMARAYNGLGEHTRALEVCERALAHVAPADLEFTALNLGVEIERALALAGLGRLEEAGKELDALLARGEGHQGPLTLGALSEARAKVALSAGDLVKARDYVTLMESHYLPTRIPTLIQRCTRLRKQLRAGSEEGSAAYELENTHSTIERLFSEGTTATHCADRVLALLAQGASEAALFVADGDATRLAATLGKAQPSEALCAWASERLKAAAADDNTVLLEEAEQDDENQLTSNGRTYLLRILYAEDAYRDVPVAALVTPRDESSTLKVDTVNALANYLHRALATD